jgi:hypothetical protein
MRTINVDNLPEPVVRAMEAVVDTLREQFRRDVESRSGRHLEEPTREQELNLVEASGSLAFWDAPGEDGYSLADGKPA